VEAAGAQLSWAMPAEDPVRLAEDWVKE